MGMKAWRHEGKEGSEGKVYTIRRVSTGSRREPREGTAPWTACRTRTERPSRARSGRRRTAPRGSARRTAPTTHTKHTTTHNNIIVQLRVICKCGFLQNFGYFSQTLLKFWFSQIFYSSYPQFATPIISYSKRKT